MSRAAKQFLLRMPDDLREALEREAKINGRSLNAEIVAKLGASLSAAPATSTKGFSSAASEPGMAYGESVSDTERAMLNMFRSWAPDKQLSFLVLFK